MSGTIESGNCRRNTSDLVDEWSHDAGIVGKDEHVKGHAGLISSADAWADRNHVTKSEGAKEIAKEVGQGLIEHVGLEMAEEYGMAASAACSGFIAGTVLGAYSLYKNAWANAHAKGDNIRDLAHNDAVNVALAQKLDFNPQFGDQEAARRPGVTNNSKRLGDQLDGKDAAMKPILQARADEGFIAMERALHATKGLAGSAQQRGAAIQAWMKNNGFEDRLRNDVAFGKGTEYCLWTQSPHPGVDASTEANKVHARQTPAQAFACRG